MILKNKKTLICFDDVLLEPQYSEIMSRHTIDISPQITVGGEKMTTPIFASPMDTVVSTETARMFVKHGISPILHRFCTIEEQLTSFLIVNATPDRLAPVGAAIGATGDYLERCEKLHKLGCHFFCIDIAHGHHKLTKEAIKNIREICKSRSDILTIMTGNVSTQKAYEDLKEWGSDLVRVSIGGGSVCSTRLVTGHGSPTLQTILDCNESNEFRDINSCQIVADGGIRTTGDIAKSIAAGARFVMLGSMLSCFNESPGEKHHGPGGKMLINYRGMASESAQKDLRGKISVVEGESVWKESKGHLDNGIETITSGIKSAFSYSGAVNIEDFFEKSVLNVVSTNTTKENSVHAKTYTS